MNITIKEFVNLLSQKDLSYGHSRGWLEDQDERFCDNSLNRQTAARIVHQFMKIELGVPDLPDITPANVLADLYTCHTCVNHIAQVYLRGVMDAEEISGVSERPFLIFNGKAFVSKEEAEKIVLRIKNLITDLQPSLCKQ